MSGATATAALREFAKLTSTNFSVLITVIGTTVLTVMLFGWYAKKKLPPEADDFEKREPLKDIHLGWYVGLFAVEIYSFCDQLTASKADFNGTDFFAATALNVMLNAIVFFICYGILKVAGVDKENPYERCKKAFMGLVILSWALMALPDYTDVPTSQNVPAVNQQVQAEFVINLNGENIFIDLNTLVRTNNTNEDAAPEFKCVLVGEDGTRQSCEFKARGIVVVYIDGIKVADSVENPDIEKVYSAIVKKFL
ncbi:MAG: hypothetical protein IJ774_01135 [Selenomonadaceae bacterium]|nr:hypothetical protein [Selenomonadaceae bacterium]